MESTHEPVASESTALDNSHDADFHLQHCRSPPAASLRQTIIVARQPGDPRLREGTLLKSRTTMREILYGVRSTPHCFGLQIGRV